MKIPITIRNKEIKGTKRLQISYKNKNDEWVTSLGSSTRVDKAGNKYYSSVIDLDQKPWKPEKKDKNEKDDNINPDDIPF